MRHVLPQSRKTISLSGQPGSRDSACKSHPPHAIFQSYKSPGHGSWGCESCVGMSWPFISWRICLMVSSIWGKYPAALDENVALEGILCRTFIAALCPRGAWLKHEGSHVCLAGYVGHVIPCVRVCKAGQHHLVVMAGVLRQCEDHGEGSKCWSDHFGVPWGPSPTAVMT